MEFEMDDKTQLRVSIQEVRVKLLEIFTNSLEKATKIWHGVLHLIITLSASFLVLTVALVEKLFLSEPPFYLITSWVLLFVSLIFGIIAELSAAIFYGNHAVGIANEIKKYNQKLSQGLNDDIITEDDSTKYIIWGDIIWGVLAINAFILAIIFMCTAFLEKYCSGRTCLVTLIICVMCLVGMNIYLLRKRKTG
jgi:hypothetical protein